MRAHAISGTLMVKVTTVSAKPRLAGGQPSHAVGCSG